MEKENFEVIMVECQTVGGKIESFFTGSMEQAVEILRDHYLDRTVTYKIWGLIRNGFNPDNMWIKKDNE